MLGLHLRWWTTVITTVIAALPTHLGASKVHEDPFKHIAGLVSFGMWQGLNNQRMCVTPAFLMAERLGYAVLLPYWRLDFLGDNSDVDRGLVPFSYLFKVDKLRELAARHGVLVMQHTSQVPEDLMASCMEQLGRTFEHHDPINTQGYFWHKVLVATPPEHRPHTVCMNDLAAIYHGLSITQAIPTNISESKLMTVAEVDAAMEPSDLFANETESIMKEIAKRFGTREFVAIHLRTEGDWVIHCRAAPTVIDNNYRCFMADEEVGHFLEHQERLPNGSLVLVCSDRNTMPAFCDKYRCFRKDEVWQNRHPDIMDHLGRETRAFLDYLLALKARAFYGHVQSTFSQELFKAYQREGRHSMHYNLQCDSLEECRRIPDAYQVPECGNIPLEECLKNSMAQQAGGRTSFAAPSRRRRRQRSFPVNSPHMGRVLAAHGWWHDVPYWLYDGTL